MPPGSAAEGGTVACCLPSGPLSARLLGLLTGYCPSPWPGTPGARQDGFGEGHEPMAEQQPGLSFAGLLRRLRDDAGLTQEELAEAASLSPRSVSDLERGVNLTARHETARLLAGALGLTGPQRALFEAAARGRAPASQVLASNTRRDQAATEPYVLLMKFMLRAVRIREIHRIWCFLTVSWPQNWSKSVFQMVSKIGKKCSKKGSFEGFLAPAPQEIMGGGIWGMFFSAPECEDDLGVASAYMPTCPLEVDFSKLIPIFLVNFSHHRKSAPHGPSGGRAGRQKSCKHLSESAKSIKFGGF